MANVIPHWRHAKLLGILASILLLLVGCEKKFVTSSPSEILTVAPPSHRLNISEVADNPAMLNALKTAISTMRANSDKAPSSVEFKTSLQFWANTHGFFGSASAPNATNFEKNKARRWPECIDFFQKSPYKFDKEKTKKTCDKYFQQAEVYFTPDNFSDNVWGTCQHTPLGEPRTPEEQAIYDAPRFLPWHRLYLYYFERSLQKYSGNADFALPYWNYFDYESNNKKGLYLPPVVAKGGSTEKNTLYDPLRTLWLNENKVTMSPSYASAQDAFGEPDFQSFSNSFEGQPHGMMHCAVGNGCATAHMGWVPVAGNDPVFYMHHANIDRLWQCWMEQEADGAEINLAWAKANLGMPDSWYDIRFEFVDENGQKVTKTIADAFSPEVLSVTYSNYANCPKIKKHAPKMEEMVKGLRDQKLAFSVHQSAGVKLQARSTSITVKDMSESLRSNKAMVDTTSKLKSGTYLLLDNIQVSKLLGFTYGVYISSKKEPSKQELVTVFNFFGFGDHGGDSLGSQRHFIDDDLSQLDIKTPDDLLIHFVPMNGVTGEVIDQGSESPITIDKVSVVTIP
ncbi:MAG: tyrosinase family protein [Gammaproteobacteria bacterium]|nr:tyrosinase family protein [Gammaproteobacteria bacterium]